MTDGVPGQCAGKPCVRQRLRTLRKGIAVLSTTAYDPTAIRNDQRVRTKGCGGPAGVG